MKNMQELIDSMIVGGALRTPRIIEAFKKVDRKNFIPESFGEYIYIDAPLPIGNDQTISQPSTVAFMLELLEPHEGDKILDIGSGSGWTTALLCSIAGKSGSVEGLERVESLVEAGKHNLSKFDFGPHCSIQKAGEALGKPGETFDRILVSASSSEIPEELFAQLKPGGVLVIPVRNSIFRFRKLSDGRISKEEYPGFRFVPLIY
ncbi:L-isoaspartyl protein carboxyl methyltransferase [Sulfurovum lithotrophicum]|uniref:Protein-L-isoaspartate O-methyltransferase n=1 Tax=Sulfurovum lithotrophicum TaxID=206403 RepID=A0A7U4M1F9_9BACT|nr:protein-L-isoaspartate O-methyltransferase [Sulfurovum lithotrophicum]AKF25124.1 L-isoaspartyl protein carboxyl methyltransferase [Sulfurovum lithotrophicum]